MRSHVLNEYRIIFFIWVCMSLLRATMTQDHRPCGFDDRNLFSLGSGQTSGTQVSALWALSEAVRGMRSSLPLACRRLPSPGSLTVFAMCMLGPRFPCLRTAVLLDESLP